MLIRLCARVFVCLYAILYTLHIHVFHIPGRIAYIFIHKYAARQAFIGMRGEHANISAVRARVSLNIRSGFSVRVRAAAAAVHRMFVCALVRPPSLVVLWQIVCGTQTAAMLWLVVLVAHMYISSIVYLAYIIFMQSYHHTQPHTLTCHVGSIKR